MAFTIAQKQNYLYISMIIATIFITILCYRIFEKKWLILREAEDKFNEGQFKEAIYFYEKGLEMGAVSSSAFHHLADAYVVEGDFTQAIPWYRAYLRLHPHDWEVRQALARALSWSGHIKEAEQEYQIILKEENELEK